MLLGAEAGVSSGLSHSNVAPPCLHQFPGTTAVQLLSRHEASLHHDMISSRFIAEEGFVEAPLRFATAPCRGAPQSRGPSPCTLTLSPLSRMPCRRHPHPAVVFLTIQASKTTHPPFRAAPKPEACNTQFLTPRCRHSSTPANFRGKTCLMLNRTITSGSDTSVRNSSLL